VNIAGKVVLITGASEGIGAALAKVFGDAGALLSLTALPAATIEESASDRLVVTLGDITDEALRQRLVERTLEAFGRIDVLVNNAGVGQYGYACEVDTGISKRLFDVNVFGPLALTQRVIEDMRRRRSGVIVNLGSVGGWVALPWATMYCASKWAVHCVSDALRRELARDGIRVMKVCPGIVATKFRDHVLAGSAPDAVADIRRVVTPLEVARAVARGVERGRRTVFVPQIGRGFAALELIAPRLMDWYLRGKF
jgi:short-subunit dehydrogenase